MDSTVNQWILNVLRPLREVLPSWPAVLPARTGDPIRPLKIGVHKDLAALLGPSPSDAHEVLGRALRRYTSSNEYRNALDAEESWRHALDGTPVEPVAAEHKGYSKRRGGQEVFVMGMKVKALKITVVLDARELKPSAHGAPVMLRVTTPEGHYAQAKLNAKSYRKAVKAVQQHGPENVAVVLQGRMIKLGEIVDAGITVQEREAPVAEPAAAPVVPPRPGRLSLKARAS
jgi:sRNA-binding protein